MNVKEYFERKQKPSPHQRSYCYQCCRPESVCLCTLIHPFHTQIRFVILMHPREARKEKNGTGRLCHLALKNSRLFVGIDFTNEQEVNALLADTEYQSVLLFPKPNAINLSQDGYHAVVNQGEKLQIFVIDGTWSLAGQILRQSENLSSLPAISFDARRPSNFRIKKQPRAECLSTLESIHLLLQLGQEQNIESTDTDIDQLPQIFEQLVDIQVKSAKAGKCPCD